MVLLTEVEALAAMAEGFARGLARSFVQGRAKSPGKGVRSRARSRFSGAPPAADPQPLPFTENDLYPVAPPVSQEQLEAMEAMLTGRLTPGHYMPGEGATGLDAAEV